MNIGYSNFGRTEIDNQVCPICGNNIYVHKFGVNFACDDINCPLGHGAKELITKIQRLLDMM